MSPPNDFSPLLERDLNSFCVTRTGTGRCLTDALPTEGGREAEPHKLSFTQLHHRARLLFRISLSVDQSCPVVTVPFNVEDKE